MLLTKMTQQPTVYLQHNTVCFCYWYSAWKEWAFTDSILFFTTLHTNHCGGRTGVWGLAFFFFFFFFKHLNGQLPASEIYQCTYTSTLLDKNVVKISAGWAQCTSYSPLLFTCSSPTHTTHTVFTLSLAFIVT